MIMNNRALEDSDNYVLDVKNTAIAKTDPVLVREISGFLVHCTVCNKMKSCTKYNHIFNNRKTLKGIGLRCTEFEDTDDHAQGD